MTIPTHQVSILFSWTCWRLSKCFLSAENSYVENPLGSRLFSSAVLNASEMLIVFWTRLVLWVKKIVSWNNMGSSNNRISFDFDWLPIFVLFFFFYTNFASRKLPKLETMCIKWARPNANLRRAARRIIT